MKRSRVRSERNFRSEADLATEKNDEFDDYTAETTCCNTRKMGSLLEVSLVCLLTRRTKVTKIFCCMMVGGDDDDGDDEEVVATLGDVRLLVTVGRACSADRRPSCCSDGRAEPLHVPTVVHAAACMRMGTAVGFVRMWVMPAHVGIFRTRNERYKLYRITKCKIANQ